ncbi:MAG: AhpC/TSA family protein [Bacteroidales bacterium]|nr:AhpC/TSA family protein [Bacteroidales bacterium]
MKRIFLLLTIITALASCGTREETNSSYFNIEGRLIGSKGGDTVSLKRVDGSGYQFADSTITALDGSFVLSAQATGVDFYVLHVNSDPRAITLVADTAQMISISAKFETFDTEYVISGSPESEDICEMVRRLNIVKRVNDSLGYIFRHNINSPDLEGLKHQLDSVYHYYENEIKTFSRNYVTQNPSSLASVVCLSQYIAPRVPVFDPKEDIKYFKSVAEALDKRFPDNYHVAKLEKYIEKIETATEQGVAVFENIKKGDKAPEIKLPNIKGDSIKLSSLRGKYVLVDFWASWSNVSTLNNQNLVRCYWKYYHSNFTIFHVSLDSDYERWKQAVKDQKLSWTNVRDRNGWNAKAIKDYGVTTLPHGILISPDGTVLATGIQSENLDQVLFENIGKPRSAPRPQPTPENN